jgi:hypothetical protein
MVRLTLSVSFNALAMIASLEFLVVAFSGGKPGAHFS